MGKKRFRQTPDTCTNTHTDTDTTTDTTDHILRHKRSTPRRRRILILRSPLLMLHVLGLLIFIFNAVVLPVAAEDFYTYQDDDYNYNNANDDTANANAATTSYYTTTPVPSPPTPYPTQSPTRYPTPSPTIHPTKQPTVRPTWSNEAFYEIESDDGYTAEAQRAKIYFSSISDVILCLMCTFFWVLWLVGTIFPTKIQHLYRNEGIIVKGYVVERYVSTTTNANAEEEEMEMQMLEMMQIQQMNNDNKNNIGDVDNHVEGIGRLDEMGMGNDILLEDDIRIKASSGAAAGQKIATGASGDDSVNLPTYHAIVSYVVPGRVASGRRKKMGMTMMGNRMIGLSYVNENYVLQKDDGKPIKTDFTRGQRSDGVNDPSKHVGAADFLGKPPLTFSRPSMKSAMITGAGDKPISPSSMVAVAEGDDENDPDAEADADANTDAGKVGRTNLDHNRRKSLLDPHTKSFESVEGMSTNWKGDERGYYKYNLRDDSDYETPMGDDEYEEDPEYIGNLFYQFGFFPKPVKKVQASEPVRVKKRFETNELLDSSLNDVEIIVLPGNPGSGILKADFEQEEDYNSILKTGGSGSQMSNFSIGMIGVVLAAVSVIGAVHGALTLPYTERVCKFDLVPQYLYHTAILEDALFSLFC